MRILCYIFGCYMYRPDDSFAFECWRCRAIPVPSDSRLKWREADRQKARVQ